MFHYNAANSFKKPDEAEELKNRESLDCSRERLGDRDEWKISTDPAGARRNGNSSVNQAHPPPDTNH